MAQIKKTLGSAPVIIIPQNCYTKSEYARLIKKTPTMVNKLIKSNKLREIAIKGGSFVIPTS